MHAPTAIDLPTFDMPAIKATRDRLTQLEHAYMMASECGATRDELDRLIRQMGAVERGLHALTMPAALRARRFANVLVQDAENRRVEQVARMVAERDQLAVAYLPCWFEEGTDVSEEMLVWPNGEIQSVDSYENEKRLQRIAANPYL